MTGQGLLEFYTLYSRDKKYRDEREGFFSPFSMGLLSHCLMNLLMSAMNPHVQENFKGTTLHKATDGTLDDQNHPISADMADLS